MSRTTADSRGLPADDRLRAVASVRSLLVDLGPHLAALGLGITLTACKDEPSPHQPPETDSPAPDSSDSGPPNSEIDTSSDTAAVDADEDGWPAGEDCDDTNDDIHPGQEEQACIDGLDGDCDGEIDEGAPESTWCSETAATWFIQEQDAFHGDGMCLSVAGDVDGDGLSDLVLGGAVGGYGRAHLFRSAWLPEGEVPTDWAALTLWGDDEDQLCSAAYTVGGSGSFVADLDGDGGSELLLGAVSAYEESDPGMAYLLRSGELLLTGDQDVSALAWTVLSDPSASTPGLGIVVADEGDVDGDGATDLVLGHRYGAFLVSGASLTSGSTAVTEGVEFHPSGDPYAFLFGEALRPVGDLDGDGLADVLLTCVNCDDDALGSAWVFLSSSLPPSGVVTAEEADLAVTGDSWGQHLGYAQTGGADVDGDGVSDWGVASMEVGHSGGAWVFTDTRSRVGQSLSVGDADLQVRRDTLPDPDYYGFASGMALGDYDADGLPELAVVDGAYVAYLLFDGPSVRAGGTLYPSDAWRAYTPREDGPFTGGPPFLDGDLDGDGGSELVVGEPWWTWYDEADLAGAALIFSDAGAAPNWLTKDRYSSRRK